MKWIKKGLIFKTDNHYSWMKTHAQLPFAFPLAQNRIRIYFGTRDAQNKTLTNYIETEAANPENVLYVHDRPILALGRLGSFDDSGVMPSWFVEWQNQLYFFYIGWNGSSTVSYRLSIGLAISTDGGKSFEKYSEGPIIDRSIFDPFFAATPSVLIENGFWRMWYVSCTDWKIIGNRPEPFYTVKYAESKDGISWNRFNEHCFKYDEFSHAFGRPCVIRKENLYQMFYSYRNSENYRTDPNKSYKIGYAESRDGISWARKDAEVGIKKSVNGWDSEMIEYCHLYDYQGLRYMFYNGNGFGQSGIGYAVEEF